VSVPADAGPTAALLAARAALTADPDAGDCVLVVAQPFGLGYRLAWVGDVRAYAWDGRVLLPLTTDHTLAQYFRDRGTVPAPAMEHQVLTSVRTAAPAEYGLASLAIPARLLLTSDGVHKTLTHETMTTIMRGAADPAAALVAAAREAGTRDNTTAAVVDNVFLPPTTQLPVLPAVA
jgi:serine/threonine protein phosphatase PrpC